VYISISRETGAEKGIMASGNLGRLIGSPQEKSGNII
jgi:hypothetical protein